MIELAMRAVLGRQPWNEDARCSPIPWREDIYQEISNQSSLTVGVLFDDGVVTPHPPVTRVVGDVVDRLKQAGHDVVMWNSDLHAECIAVMVRHSYPLQQTMLCAHRLTVCRSRTNSTLPTEDRIFATQLLREGSP